MFRSFFRRLLALDDPPERTALVFSIGVFITFSPLLGPHTILPWSHFFSASRHLWNLPNATNNTVN